MRAADALAMPRFWPFVVRTVPAIFSERVPPTDRLDPRHGKPTLYGPAPDRGLGYTWQWEVLYAPRGLGWLARLIAFVRGTCRREAMFWLADHYLIQVDEGGIMALGKLTLRPWLERKRRVALLRKHQDALAAALLRDHERRLARSA